MSDLEKKVSDIKEKLLDPFDVSGLERDFEELLDLMRRSRPEELKKVRNGFEEVRQLLLRNISIISGGLKPLLEKGQGGLFSRRV